MPKKVSEIFQQAIADAKFGPKTTQASLYNLVRSQPNSSDVVTKAVGEEEAKEKEEGTLNESAISSTQRARTIGFKKNTVTVVPVQPTREGSAEHLQSLLVEPTWKRVLDLELRKEYMHNIVQFLEAEKTNGKKIYPPRELTFNALNLTPLDRVRVMIIGQDPYHNENQATGLSFSVPKGVRVPPSLRNIYKELKADIPNFKIPDHGCLESWARQGVLMLASILTVEAGKTNSHSGIGWQKFTDEVVRIVSRECDGVVFLLWGRFGHKKEPLVDCNKHVIIKTAHPSPLSMKLFFGCRCFSKTNAALAKLGHPPIDWSAL